MSDNFAQNNVDLKPLHVRLYDAHRAQMAKHGIVLPTWDEACVSASNEAPVIGPWIAVEQCVLRYYREALTGGPVPVGAVVRLRCGGPLMTVTRILTTSEVAAEWHTDSGEPMKATYPVEALLVESRPKPRAGTVVDQALLPTN